MNDFKKSFYELKKPIVWLHYVLGTIGIVLIFSLLMDKGILGSDSQIFNYSIIFLLTYVVVDRTSHAILKI